MRVVPLGDRAYWLTDLPGPAHAIAEGLRRLGLPGIEDVAASDDTVGVYVAQGFDPASLPAEIEPVSGASRDHRIPLCFELGEDLMQSARALDLSLADVADLVCAHEFHCRAVGFCPGFPYLGPIPAPLQGLPRRPQPRTRVEPGSFAIVGNQAGIYPLPRPGGWNLLARTPLVLVDVEADYFPIQPGDVLRFWAVTPAEFESRRGERLGT
jgi:inhibitor of KinA